MATDQALLCRSVQMTVMILFSVITVGLSQQVDTSVEPLSCGTWGKPDWSGLEAHLRKSHRTREFDQNIRSMVPVVVGESFLNDDLYLRWMLRDSTVSYEIRLTIDGYVFYKEVLNACGIKIHSGLLSLSDDDNVQITVEPVMEEKEQGLNWGLFFELEPLSKKRKEAVREQMDDLKEPVTGYDVYFNLVDFFLDKQLALNALSVLEYAIEQSPNDKLIIDKYWKVVNDLNIQ